MGTILNCVFYPIEQYRRKTNGPNFYDTNFRMRAIASFPSRGKGAFALRWSLKVRKDTACELNRFPGNERGAIRSGFLNL